MNVLLVDDLPTQRFLLASLVSQFDCSVFVAKTGEEAIELATQVKPDAVLLDLCMPEMDGYELATRLRNDAGLTETKLVAVSAWDCDVPKLAEAGIDRYVRKPVNLRALKIALER